VLQPQVFVGRDSSIGPDCCIGPFASIPRESIVPAGTVVAGNISYENTVLSARGERHG
jgi:acetyltransferase-like isoleucine patch superfamily enzyme